MAVVDRKKYMQEYYRIHADELKAKKREYRRRPDVKAKMREYSRRPDVKAKMREQDRLLKDRFERQRLFKKKYGKEKAGEKQMSVKVLDEVWYNSCMNCGGYMETEHPYDFWCCERCKQEGEMFIKKIGEEYAEALGTEKQAGEKK